MDLKINQNQRMTTQRKTKWWQNKDAKKNWLNDGAEDRFKNTSDRSIILKALGSMKTVLEHKIDNIE